MRLYVIACEVLFRELALAAAQTEAVVDLVFLRKGLHDDPDLLREKLQAHIREADSSEADAVVLGYGLCSNATAGVVAGRLRLVIPRAHDCITLFLGSRERYEKLFGQRPGTYYYTSGWLERGSDTVPQAQRETSPVGGQSFDELVARYGEDNARFLMEIQGSWRQHYTTACYIRMPLSHRPEYAEQVRKIAADNGWEYLEVEGDDRLIRAMVSGKWSDQDFLIVQPGEQIRPSYDGRVLCTTAQGGQR